MITPQTVQLILDAARIEDVVGEFVTLKRRGTNLTGLCPFHNERTPSFSVSPTKGIFKCFGCGKGGDSVGFVMEHENVSYPDALRYLARRYNIEIAEKVYTQEVQDEKLRLDSLFIINEYAREYYTAQLMETDYGKSIGLAYFKQRGLREDTILRFGLGFAPEGYDIFTKHAAHKGFAVTQLQQAGVTRSDGRDFFRNRVLFPIHNVSGRVVGFGGRVMAAEQQPKYLNTGETEIYSKSKLLYGIFQAKKAIRQLDECILTEGYLDVISLSQAGIENVVASSGTSLTVEQIQLIKRHTPNVKILYDGDAAGIKAALRGLDLVLEQGLNVKVVLFPQGEDPDSYVQKIGAAAFKEFIKNEAKDFILFKTQTLLKAANNDPIEKVKLLRDIVESIAKIPDPMTRSVYIRECSTLLQMSEQVLVTEVNKLAMVALNKANAPKLPSEEAIEALQVPTIPLPEAQNLLNNEEYQERDVVRILLLFGDKILSNGVPVAHFVLAVIEEIIEEFDNKLYQGIVQEYLAFAEKETLPTQQYFIGHQDKAVRELAIFFLTYNEQLGYSHNWIARLEKPLATQLPPDENFDKDMMASVRHFKLRKVIRLMARNQMEIKKTPPDDENFIILLHLHTKLTQMRTVLANELGIQGALK
jgi:DNA primase